MPAPVYATLEQLATELNVSVEDLPLSASSQLRKASRQIDAVLIGAVYATDENDLPADVAINEAITNATLAQVQYWLAGYGTEHGKAIYSSVSIGSVSLGGNASSGSKSDSPSVAPQAMFELEQIGLLPVSAIVRG